MAVRLNRLTASASHLDGMRPACSERGYSEHQSIVQ